MTRLCRLFGVTRAGYYAWRGRPVSARDRQDRVLLQQARRPNRIWVGDLTYLWAAGRWWYLVVILDQYSRRVLAWRLTATRDAAVTRAVLDAAVRRRQPARGLILHTDRGSEFLGAALKTRVARCGGRQSMTRGGAPGENAHVESFFRSLKAELIKGQTFPSVRGLRHELQRWVQYYNHRRLHSALGYRSPVDYEHEAA